MKAITTRYMGPTNTRGARILATDVDKNRVTIPYPYELSGQDVHQAAAKALCEKMGWEGELIGGSTKRGYVFVFDSRVRANVIERNGKAVQSIADRFVHRCEIHNDHSSKESAAMCDRLRANAGRYQR